MMNYEKILSERVKSIQFSGIRKFFDIAATMENVISLSVGEPDFKTPWAIRRKAILSLEMGHTQYGSNAGIEELRRECCKYLQNIIGVSYDPLTEAVVTVGGSEAIDLAVRALVNTGDEVLVPEPSFVCYSPIVELAGGTAVPIVTKVEDNFKLTPEDLKAVITPKTKALILPFPNNPTGGVMRRDELGEIAKILRGTDIMVISDEIYAELTYGGERHVSIASFEGMRERTIVINGFSKAFAMTGWRLGWVAGPEPVITQILKIHQYAIMCSPITSQYAAITALSSPEVRKDVDYMVSEYDMRRRLCVKSFNDMGLECFNPEGAFYVFPCIKSTGLSSEEFCERLIKAKRVAVVPGTAFGASGEGFVRVSYAYSLKHLTDALKRIEEFLREGSVCASETNSAQILLERKEWS
ncbi:MAG: aminotransferase class I/II-fold pyridoxal phosphate-dependent enzyme [Oscillospiraceae bacterium]|jgi:aminotransferase|nr:aminotransferase class I/II-fold pyridoxal phosphate-dependent enzyme [Oscillospiraceae bacterium]